MAFLKKMLTRAGTGFDFILNTLAGIAGFLIVFATLSVGISVVMRYFFNSPVSWVTEICEYILLYITFLVAAWVLRKEGHVKMDLIIDQFKSRVKIIINIIFLQKL